jgi:small GTP-binding protein
MAPLSRWLGFELRACVDRSESDPYGKAGAISDATVNQGIYVYLWRYAREITMSVEQECAADVLHDYARLKLDLAAIVRSLLHAAERAKDEMSVQECRRLLARLAEDRFNLAIVGQFSRGKSSLMNALLGSEKLPTGILPLTSVITTVTYGETERVLIQRESWALPQAIKLDQLAEYVTQDGNPGNEKGVVLAEVQLPNELLRLGVHFVDTPGIASSIAANTRTTRQFLPEADAAILVTSFESPMTEAEVKFLQEVREHVRKVFIVVNKLDLAPENDREPVLAALRETVRIAFPAVQPAIFAVSARRALHAKRVHSTEELAQSGFPALETALSEFLRTGKAHEFLLRAADRAALIARQQEIAIRIAQRAASPEQIGALKGRVKDLSATLTQDRDTLISAMRLRLPRQFRERGAEIAPLWNPEVEAVLGSDLEAWFARDLGELTGTAFQEFLQKTFQRVFCDWLSKHQDPLNRLFQQLIAEENEAIVYLAGRIVALPADVLGGDHGTFLPRSLNAPLPVFQDLRVTQTGIEPPWWYEFVPSGSWRRYLARRWRRRASEFGPDYQQAAATLLETAMDDWIESVNRKLSTRIERASGHVSNLLEQKPKLAELSELEQLIDRIQAFMNTVLRMGSDASSPRETVTLSGTAVVQHPVSLPPCRICVRLEKTMRDFMAHRQYELSVSESEQRNHALRSGFCPLHTWQYEAIASPQGVCAAYAELLSVYAKRIRLLVQEESSVQALESGLRAMLPNVTSCAACELVTATEKAAAREIARQLTNNDFPSGIACAFHLRAILMAGPERDAAAKLLLGEARVFVQLAENMQNHVLKHEAVRRNLSTSAEEEAATNGLARLVGRRDTVTPWRID